jgi:hypothetical protein
MNPYHINTGQNYIKKLNVSFVTKKERRKIEGQIDCAVHNALNSVLDSVQFKTKKNGKLLLPASMYEITLLCLNKFIRFSIHYTYINFAAEIISFVHQTHLGLYLWDREGG